jgi:hypothetical protein
MAAGLARTMSGALVTASFNANLAVPLADGLRTSGGPARVI